MFKRTILAGCFSLFAGLATYAQFPAEGINYQAVARNAQGTIITSPITVRISVHAGSPAGPLQYQETHNTTPNALGLFNITIGQGTFVTGAVNNFNQINWGANSHFAKTEINTGSGFVDMGTTQLWAVPYALYAKNAGNGGSGGTSYTAGAGIGISGNVISAADVSPTNEIQTLSLSGSALSISGGNTVNLPTGTTYTAGTGISIVGNVISATGGGGTSYVAGSGINISGNTISAVDNSATNEIQTLSQSGNTITLSNGGGSVTVTDAQTLSISGANLSISGGNTVTLPTGTTYTAGSGISITGNTISATDNSTTNELQTLSVSGNTLSISNGNSVTLPAGSGGGTLDEAYDFGGAGAGRTITADAGSVTINASGTGAGNIGLVVNHTGTNTAAIGASMGSTATGNAINASSSNPANAFSTIQATTASNTANNSAIFGQSTGAAKAITGEVTAASTADVAVRGFNARTNGGIGVEGVGFNGVSGQTNYMEGVGVIGENFDLIGTQGVGIGVAGIGYYAVVGEDTYLGSVPGAFGVFSNGNFGSAGTKSFHIDHPLDPENKFLKHFSIESNEVLNVYRGTVVADANGEAIVTLPNYFHAININFSYQLTAIGQYAPVFIKEKIQNGTFKIAGAQPGMEISWQVYAERNDPYLQKYPHNKEVEVQKTQREQGKYLIPALYGQPKNKGLFYRGK